MCMLYIVCLFFASVSIAMEQNTDKKLDLLDLLAIKRMYDIDAKNNSRTKVLYVKPSVGDTFAFEERSPLSAQLPPKGEADKTYCWMRFQDQKTSDNKQESENVATSQHSSSVKSVE